MSKSLAEHLAAQRWFRGKSRTIVSAAVEEAIPIEGCGAVFAFVTVKYGDDAEDAYVLVVRADDGELRDELGHPEVAAAILRAFEAEVELGSARCRVRFRATPALAAARLADAGPLEIRTSGVEQSNTSIMYGRLFVLKVMRRVECGGSPDVEMGAFLTRAGFTGAPAVAGWIEMARASDAGPADPGWSGAEETCDAARSTIGILHRFVPNRGDAWAFTLSELARSTDPATYAAHARRIGERTAQMHAALASAPASDAAFAPEPFDEGEQTRLAAAVKRTLHAAFRALDATRATLDAATQMHADAVLRARAAIEARIDRFARTRIGARRTRIHGDLHLGQLLVTPDDDFVIVDFEGEPARPLAERRQKRSPIADVAGMVRSFHYASFTSRAPASWHRVVARTFLDAYAATLAGAASFPKGDAELAVLVDFYLLEKAIYELSYEIENRPSWVIIPLAGLLELIDE